MVTGGRMIRESFYDRVFIFFNHLFVWFLLLIVLYPLIYIASASISNPTFVNSGQMWLLPKGITFEGFQRVFQNDELWIGYRNTIFYTVFGTALNLLVTLPCAYALSRRDLAGRNAIMALFVFTMFFSGGLIPSYLLMKDLGMVNTVWAMLLPNLVGVWNIIVTRTFFQSSIPRELEEAAEIDGCSTFRLFVQIVLPLSAPIIAVMALFYGVGQWNAYFNALIYLSNRDLFPLQLFLREILVQNEMADSMVTTGDLAIVAEQARIADMIKYAVMMVASLPLLAVYPFLQRYFVKGVMVGSLKG
jgi:putative aldouronate transport system permease protein